MRLWRKKRPDIANGGGYYCVHRGISVMRLALGYKAGLPKGFEKIALRPRGLDPYGVIRLARLSFPNHKILIFCDSMKCLRDVQSFDLFRQYVRPDWDDKYLWGFSYTVEGTPEAHFVVGMPVTYSGELQAVLAIGVEI